MRRCHYCGKILNELPYTCRRCGHTFCSDHHLPENHHCSGHHHHDHKPHYRLCENCSNVLTGLPFTCHRCGMFLCEQCHLPENHRCVPINSNPEPVWTSSVSQNSEKPSVSQNTVRSTVSKHTVKSRTSSKLYRRYWNKFVYNITLKNFAIFSILLILAGFLPTYYTLINHQELFHTVFEVGVFCFVFAYFLYALKCWEATSQICAVLMITIPLFAYIMSTSKISDSTINSLFYFGILFCIIAIMSAILLYISDKIKMGIEGYIFKTSRRSYQYFNPRLSYSVIGVLVVSLLVVNFAGFALFSDNTATITQSLSNFNTPTSTNLNTNTPMPSTTEQNSQIILRSQNPTPIPTVTPKLDYKQSPKTVSYYYNIDSNRKSMGFTTYGGLSDYFSKESHSYYNDADKEVIMELLENSYQDEYLQPFIDSIRKSSTNPDDQAKIAVSLVQHIPYNWNKYYNPSMDWYYPYETLYNNRGVCADKSLLLAYLLNKLGYDTVVFEFSNHMAVGVKSSSNYGFYNTGYAFIETTRPSIITYVPDTYLSGFKVTSNPHIIHLNGGKKVLDLSNEYRDAVRMKQLEAMGTVLDQTNYAEWLRISNNYDLQYDT
jgi:hypothetical protein